MLAMRRLFVFGLCGLALAFVLIAPLGSSGSAQDSVPATVAALQTSVAGLSTAVAEQATQISDLQTSVADKPGTPVASPTELPDPETLEITITFRTDPENVESDGLGSECSGLGRFRDFAPDADIAIYDIEEEKLAEASLVSSKLIHEGVVFHECEMRFVIEEIPYEDTYIIGITNRSALTHDYAELAEMDWALNLHYAG
jgi:hypothetical protein